MLVRVYTDIFWWMMVFLTFGVGQLEYKFYCPRLPSILFHDLVIVVCCVQLVVHFCIWIIYFDAWTVCIVAWIFNAFEEKYPTMLIQLTTFSSLKPWFVRNMKEWSTCCCHYHNKHLEFKIGLNNTRSKNRGVRAHYTFRCVQICGPPTVD